MIHFEEDLQELVDHSERPIINGHICPTCGADVREGTHFNICEFYEA